MNVTYKITTKNIDEGLNFLERMNENVQVFLDKFPQYNYSESIEKGDVDTFIVLININDGKEDEQQVYKEFTEITKAFGAL